MHNGVPMIDIGPWFEGDEAVRAGIATAVDQACAEWGFLVVKGHGVDPSKCPSSTSRPCWPVRQRAKWRWRGRSAPHAEDWGSSTSPGTA